VLAGDYLFSWVFKKVTQKYPNPIPTILAAMLAEICNGEVKQLRAAGNVELPVSAYLEIIGKKTAELFAACAEVGALGALLVRGDFEANSPARALPDVKALRAYGWSFGMAFQIRDDLLDVTAEEQVIGKPAGSDLRERKVTLPLIYALEDSGRELRAQVDALFSTPDTAAPEAAPAVSSLIEAIRAGSAIERSVATMAEYAVAAVDALATLRASDARDELADLAQTLTEFS
jgi:geranylgeranyl pyrophosphate synthase